MLIKRVNSKLTNKQIKTIIFDLGNVLVKVDYKFFLINTGLDNKYTENEIYEVLAEPAILYEKGIINSIEFYKAATKILSLEVDYEMFYFAWCSVLSEQVEGMENILKVLNKAYPLYLLSNTNEKHLDHVKNNFQFLGYFKECFLSYLIGSMKPEKQIYEYVLKHIKFLPEEILYIDDKTQNILTAQELGINSHRFVDTQELDNFIKSNLMVK